MRSFYEGAVCTLVLLLVVGAMAWLPTRITPGDLPWLFLGAIGLLGLYYARYRRLP